MQNGYEVGSRGSKCRGRHRCLDVKRYKDGEVVGEYDKESRRKHDCALLVPRSTEGVLQCEKSILSVKFGNVCQDHTLNILKIQAEQRNRDVDQVSK